MAFKGEGRVNKIYILIAVVVIVIIILAIFLSANQLFIAYIDDNTLGSIWKEDINERGYSSNLLGFEKWASRTYRNYNETYPAYVTVTSMKTLFMINENELFSKTIETINKASQDGIVIDENSTNTGIRALRNGHNTHYIIYDGNDTSKNPPENIKIIGECWSCGISGTSVICIGFAQVTDNAHNNSAFNDVYWSEIIRDSSGLLGPNYQKNDGLIYNVKCH